MTLTREDLEARASVATEARDYLDASLTRHEAIKPKDRPAQETRVPDAHKALRLLYEGTPIEEPFPEDVVELADLAELIWQALEEITQARRAALAAGPVVKDPAAEFERLLGKAEEAAAASGGHDRARTLAEIAGRWLTPELTSARKRSSEAGIQHFGSPTTAPTSRYVKAVDDALQQLDALNLANAVDYIAAAVKLAAAAVPLDVINRRARAGATGTLTGPQVLAIRASLSNAAELSQ